MEDRFTSTSDPLPSVFPTPDPTPSLETSITPRQAVLLAASFDISDPSTEPSLGATIAMP